MVEVSTIVDSEELLPIGNAPCAGDLGRAHLDHANAGDMTVRYRA